MEVVSKNSKRPDAASGESFSDQWLKHFEIKRNYHSVTLIPEQGSKTKDSAKIIAIEGLSTKSDPIPELKGLKKEVDVIKFAFSQSDSWHAGIGSVFFSLSEEISVRTFLWSCTHMLFAYLATRNQYNNEKSKQNSKQAAKPPETDKTIGKACLNLAGSLLMSNSVFRYKQASVFFIAAGFSMLAGNAVFGVGGTLYGIGCLLQGMIEGDGEVRQAYKELKNAVNKKEPFKKYPRTVKFLANKYSLLKAHVQRKVTPDYVNDLASSPVPYWIAGDICFLKNLIVDSSLSYAGEWLLLAGAVLSFPSIAKLASNLIDDYNEKSHSENRQDVKAATKPTDQNFSREQLNNGENEERPQLIRKSSEFLILTFQSLAIGCTYFTSKYPTQAIILMGASFIIFARSNAILYVHEKRKEELAEQKARESTALNSAS